MGVDQPDRKTRLAIVSPSHLSTMAPLMDMTLLFRGLDHCNAVREQAALNSVAFDVLANASVRLFGHAGGGTRHAFADRDRLLELAEPVNLARRTHGRPYGLINGGTSSRARLRPPMRTAQWPELMMAGCAQRPRQ